MRAWAAPRQAKARGRGNQPDLVRSRSPSCSRRVAAGRARQGARGAGRETPVVALEKAAQVPRRGCAALLVFTALAAAFSVPRRGRIPRRDHAVRRQQAELFAAPGGNYGALPAGFVFSQISSVQRKSNAAARDRPGRSRKRIKQYTARRRIAYFGFGYGPSVQSLGEAPPTPAFLAPLRDKVAAWMGLAPETLRAGAGHGISPGYGAGLAIATRPTSARRGRLARRLGAHAAAPYGTNAPRGKDETDYA